MTAAPFSVAAGLALIISLSSGPQPLALAVTETCVPAQFAPVSGGEEALVPEGNGWHFRSESWLGGTVCSPGTLKVIGRGELGGPDLPQLTVAQGDGIVKTLSLGAEQETTDVQIPHAGQIYLGYLNDFYRSDARIATLYSLSLVGASCGGLTPAPPSVPSLTWTPETEATELLGSPPLVIVPCGSGTFSMQVVGRQGGGVFPALEIMQAGRTLLQMEAGARVSNVRLTVGPEPLTVVVTNPYFETLANRDLHLARLIFIPSKSQF